eukprot:m.258840 g.258840  ORF g.258840 m.258840 type:complete len:496 (+) comp19652_c0_seq1:151-1638(+)
MRSAVLVMLGILGCNAISLAPPANSSIRVTLTQSGLNELSAIVLPIIQNALNGSISIPDIHIDTHVPEPIGHITLDLTDITLSGVRLADGSIKVAPPHAVSLSLSGMDFDVNMDFKWRKVHSPHASDHGEVSAKPSDASALVAVQTTVLPTGVPHVNLTQGSTTIGSFDIHFDGKVSWLYNLFTNLFENQIKDAISKAVSKALGSAVDVDLNKVLGKFPTAKTIGGGKSRLDVNTQLLDLRVSNGTAADGGAYMTIGDYFAIADNLTHALCPPAEDLTAVLPDVVPGAAASESMVQIMLSTRLFDCALWVPFHNGALDVSNIPGGPTSAWLAILPTLPLKYPNATVRLDLTPSAQPLITARANADGGLLSASLGYNINVSVVTNGTDVYAVTLRATAATGIELETVCNTNGSITLYGNVTTLDVNVTVVRSAVGFIDKVALELISKLVGPIVEKAVNSVLANGFTLPATKGIRLLNASTLIENGYIAIVTDFGEA